MDIHDSSVRLGHIMWEQSARALALCYFLRSGWLEKQEMSRRRGRLNRYIVYAASQNIVISETAIASYCTRSLYNTFPQVAYSEFLIGQRRACVITGKVNLIRTCYHTVLSLVYTFTMATPPPSGLRGTVVPYLTRMAHFSSPFITTFLLIHLSSPILANLGGSSLASQTMVRSPELNSM